MQSSSVIRCLPLLLCVSALAFGCAGAQAGEQAAAAPAPGRDRGGKRAAAPAAEARLDPIAARLQEAWRLYGFGESKSAEHIFGEVLAGKAATADQKLQARIGHTFVVQYRQPGRDPAAALALYRGILADLPPGHAWRALVLSRMGACCIESKQPDPAKCREHLARAIKNAARGSLVQQECVLQLALSHLQGDPRKREIKQALAELHKGLPLLRGGVLEGAGHNLAAGLALLLDDPRLMERELKAWVKAGIHNFTFRAAVYFKIARINELVMHNFDQARHYYQRLAREEPSDARSYFSRMRAREIDMNFIGAPCHVTTYMITHRCRHKNHIGLSAAFVKIHYHRAMMLACYRGEAA